MRKVLLSSLVLALFGCPGGKGGSDTGKPPTTTSTGGTTVTAPQAPRAEDDLAAVEEGGVTSIQVTTNDLVTTNPLALGSVTIVGPPNNGDVVVNANGSVVYTHDGGESSTDSFTYTVEDDAGIASNVASVRITVTPVNDLPVAVDDNGNVDQGDSVTLPLLGNDIDVDDGLDPSSIAIVTAPTRGGLVDNGNGSVEYQHNGAGVPTDSFQYTVSDFSGAVSNVATVSLAVFTTNVPPTAIEDFAIVPEGGLANVNVAANDTDPDDGVDVSTVTIVVPAAHGTTLALGDGTVDYQHDGSETVADSFSYQVNDVSGATSNTTFVQIAIAPVNDAPTANNDSIVVGEGLTTNANVLANDTDADGLLDPLTVTLGTLPANGTAIVRGTGTIDYTHDGSPAVSDSFTYTVRDSGGLISNVATVSVQINQVNDPPTAVDDDGLLAEGGTEVIDLATNDFDSDDALDLNSVVIISDPVNGTVLINGDGTVEYTHNGSETVADGFAYTIDDVGGNSSNIAAVTLVITPVNDPPVAVNDSFVVSEGGLNNVQNVLSNDTDADNGIAANSIVIDSPPINGSVYVNMGGTVEYSHNGTNTVADSYTYHVLDVSGAASNIATVSISVTGVNDPPVAVNDQGLLAEGASLNILVLSNDTDIDNGIDTATTAVVAPPSNGSAVVQPGGSITYTHNGSETVSDSFTYVVRDLAGLTSNQATVTIVINPVNDAPTAVNDAEDINEGAAVLISVLANDSDPDSAIVPASTNIVSPPINGSASANPDGTILYTHSGSETVTDSFTYRVNDDTGATSNTATVTITITPVNDTPTAVNDTGGSVNEGSAKNVSVLDNDSDPDDGLNPASVVVVTPPSNGSTNVLGDGSITYSHNGSETASDSFTYTVSDFGGATSSPATVSFTINPVNDAPVAVNDSFGVAEGDSANVAVLGNDTDPDDGLNPASVVIVAAPTNGTAVAQPDGSINYTHNGSNTTSDSFTYRVNDMAGTASNVATVTVNVTAVNDAPVAVNDSANLNEGAALAINVVANDTDADDAIDPTTVVIIAQPSRGTAVPQPAGTVLYTHNGSENFTDSFTYRVNDTVGGTSNTATVSITINPANDPPVAVANPGINLAEGAMVNIPVLNNDTDADDGIDPSTVTVTTPPTRGSFAVQPNGSINYTHNGTENFTDSFSYTVKDFAGATSNIALVSIVITPVNDPPVAVNNSANVNEGATVNIPLAANDTDVDDGIDPASIQIWSAASHAALVVNPNGSVDYQHNGSEASTDSFTYRIDDFAGATSNVATVNVTINPINDAPVAVNNPGVVVLEGALVNINVLANDTDADDGLNSGSVVIVSAPTRGSAVVQGNGTINYTHNGGETLSDSFTYRVSDFAGAQSNTATVGIVVTPVNDAPVAVNDSANLNQFSSVNINLAGNDTDVDSSLDLASISIVSYPNNGNVFINANGTVDYSNYGGTTDAFLYTIRDTAGATSNAATVSITLNVVSVPPTANDDVARVPTEVWSTINAFGNDTSTDPYSTPIDPSSLVILSGPSNGTAFANGDGTVEYLHDWTSGSMVDSFTYRIANTAGQTDTATVSITVNEPSDCVVTFEDAFDAIGFANPTTFYQPTYGLTFTRTGVNGSGVLGGIVNGDPGNWDVEGTNGTSSWGMWNGTASIDFDEPVVYASLDFIRAASDISNVTVDAYLEGSLVDSTVINLTNAWTFQTVAFDGPLDRIEWNFGTNFLGVDDIRFGAPTLPCSNRLVEIVNPSPLDAQNDSIYWSNKGYEFRAEETFSITGGAWWTNIPVGGYVELRIYSSAGTLLATGNRMEGTGVERWNHSELNYTFTAGTNYLASFYTNRGTTGLHDHAPYTITFPFDVDGLMTVTGHKSSLSGGDNSPVEFPTSDNSWYSIQRLIRASEQVQDMGAKSGSGDFSCPPNWRLPNLGEFDTVLPWLGAGYIGYYQNIAVNTPSGCICKWNQSWCGEPSIETYDGRMCGDFSQNHMCVDDR